MENNGIYAFLIARDISILLKTDISEYTKRYRKYRTTAVS